MRYYLSYLESVNNWRHSFLMLSEQPDEVNPTKIICEVGFGFAPNSNIFIPNPNIFIPADYLKAINFFQKNLKGHVREEKYVNGLVSSENRYNIKHRTYEISKAEMEKFFHIINRDRKKNVSMVTWEEEWEEEDEWFLDEYEEAVGGPDYHLFTHNCKDYAISLLKEIGIVEAEKLSNFFIQRSGTSDSLLKTLAKEELFVKESEQFQEIDELFWKTSPPIATRFSLNNFNVQEKAIYLLSVKTNKMLVRLQQILSDFNNRIVFVKRFDSDKDRNLHLDLCDLKAMLDKTEKTIDESHKEFLKSIGEKASQDAVVYEYHKQQKIIGESINSLEKSLSDFKPRSEKASIFMRYINKIIGYFKKDFITLENMESLMKEKIASLKQASRAIDTRLSISESNVGFFKSTKNIKDTSLQMISNQFVACF